jgi:thiopurine S-methyltransferase
MDAQFWIDAWKEGRTGFHQSKYHDKLLQYFPQLGARPGQRVFVPLCGKTLDMLWLQQQGLQVMGVELYQEAVKAFFVENALAAPEITQQDAFTVYQSNGIEIRCGDFFQLDESVKFELMYDRAALVALPQSMRQAYAHKTLSLLAKGGKCLLISFEYDPAELQGPPFSVDEAEIQQLYGNDCRVTLLERENLKREEARFAALSSFHQTVYLLEN